MYEIDSIVYAGESKNEVTVKQVKARNDRTLVLRFSTGEQKVFCATALIEEGGVFAKLADIDLFMQAHVDYDTVVWNDTIDIAAEYLYAHSVLLEHECTA